MERIKRVKKRFTRNKGDNPKDQEIQSKGMKKLDIFSDSSDKNQSVTSKHERVNSYKES